MVAVHDCDILTYNRELLARLCYPVAHPNLGFDFCKGYYARVSDKLNGRVMRLLVTPLIRALKSILGAHAVSRFTWTRSAIRSPASSAWTWTSCGACASRTTGRLRWACSRRCFRNCSPRASASPSCATTTTTSTRSCPRDDADKGLNKMAVDIAKSVFRTMAAEGIKLDAGLFDTLLSAYVRQAEDTMRFYASDAAINGLRYPRHDEENAVDTFVRSIRGAAESFLDDPLWSPLIPNWNRVQSALPLFFDELNEAVRLDSGE